MAEKKTLDRNKLLLIADPTIKSFLNALGSQTDASKLSDGMWNKLYAIIATIRNIEKVNYWVYTDYAYDYDVHLRTIEPHHFDNGCTIGELKHGNNNPSPRRNRRNDKCKAWRYDQQ
jgi:hypothetical protein